MRQFNPKDTSKRRKTQVTDLGFDENDLWIAALQHHSHLEHETSSKKVKRLHPQHHHSLSKQKRSPSKHHHCTCEHETWSSEHETSCLELGTWR
ncbi:hypothetical protein [Halotia branconii]|uniref:Uncharacterized protein n=1 Tax=Halotia branconii CENA392 TaxID=1539056 RepID=A0AAJ6NSD6_9CYAN|nr:hypothetical protein [Halotia branconii]WGV25843.1 hypothetical protein QI031_29710 [Halotia branconii CENA392]